MHYSNITSNAHIQARLTGKKKKKKKKEKIKKGRRRRRGYGNSVYGLDDKFYCFLNAYTRHGEGEE